MNLLDVPQSLLDALNLEFTADIEWPDPEEVSRPLAEVPRLNANMLPKAIRRRVYDIAYRMQCPVDFVATPLLVTLGSIIGSRCAVRPKQRDNWTEYPNIWGAVIAPPGHLKTPAVSEALRVFHPLERRAQEEHDIAMLQYVAESFAREMHLKALHKQVGKQADKGAAAAFGDPVYQRMAELKKGIEPSVKRYRTNDATVEKLAELCVANPQGLLVIRDELVGLLASLVKEGHEGDRAFYLEGWNGNATFRQDRIGRGSIVVERLCLSVFGTIQPMRLQAFMYGIDGLQHDGLLQRFQVMVYPDSTTQRKIIDQLPDQIAEDALEALAGKLAYMDFEAMGAAPGEGRTASFYRFDVTAQETFYSWLTQLEAKIDGEDSPLVAEHLSKYRKLVPAIALIFHLVAIAETGRGKKAIEISDLHRAIKWADYLEAHARRIFGQATDIRLVAARALQQKIKVGALQSGFTERDVYRAGWTHLNDPELARVACQELVAAGWIRQIREKHATKPGSPKYEINPKLAAKGSGPSCQN